MVKQLTTFTLCSVTAKRDTEKALLCSGTIDCNGIDWVFSDTWIPKSQIHEDYHDEIDQALAGETIEIAVSDWWVEQQQ